MNQKILFCRISWKKEYKTEDGAWNGGQFVEDNEEGGERHNFLPFRGYCYGYFQPTGATNGKDGAEVNTNINRLGANGADSIDNIDIIWIAKNPQVGGRWVVGVYKNATVYKESQIIKGDKRRKVCVYRAKATECDSFVLPERIRNIKIPATLPIMRAGVYYHFEPYEYPAFSKNLKNLLKTGKKMCEKIEKEENDRIRKYGKGGESEEHKKLKRYAQKHPELFGVSRNAKSNVEYPLPSGDLLDVLFKDGDKWTAVEVKSCRSDDNDLKRGIYQCVKYRAVLEAMKKAEKCPQKLEVFLLSEKPLSDSLKQLSKKLGVKTKLHKRT